MNNERYYYDISWPNRLGTLIQGTQKTVPAGSSIRISLDGSKNQDTCLLHCDLMFTEDTQNNRIIARISGSYNLLNKTSNKFMLACKKHVATPPCLFPRGSASIPYGITNMRLLGPANPPAVRPVSRIKLVPDPQASPRGTVPVNAPVTVTG